ncbi:5,6-dimethylbenzimidazole synthase [Phenylobacterium sp. LjRoot225]|uniref:5,6-dimethylbenzimidazole synthase n=1 Tax=Phenylobacterium sp. LjRoot225 TaxID=3342285 RepID=UPI003ED0ADEA
MTDPHLSEAAAPPSFDAAFQARLHQLFVWRRDVRRFRTDPPPPGTLQRLIEEACLGPSVGLSQPWRFVIVDDPARRAAVIDNFRTANREALETYSGERRARYAQLKLAGLQEAPCHFAVFVDEATPIGHGLGRRTMPEMLRYSAVAAICQLWLAARAEDIGMGWVSILDPAAVRRDLEVPADWSLIGYFCLGYPAAAAEEPELLREGWERRLSVDSFILRR